MNHNSLIILEAIMQGNRRGISPTVRELMHKTGLKSLNAISGSDGQLNSLARAGLIEWEPHKARTLRATCVFIPANQPGEGRERVHEDSDCLPFLPPQE